jgi:hypothetical protein
LCKFVPICRHLSPKTRNLYWPRHARKVFATLRASMDPDADLTACLAN